MDTYKIAKMPDVQEQHVNSPAHRVFPVLYAAYG
jgi:hypothetical protein